MDTEYFTTIMSQHDSVPPIPRDKLTDDPDVLYLITEYPQVAESNAEYLPQQFLHEHNSETDAGPVVATTPPKLKPLPQQKMQSETRRQMPVYTSSDVGDGDEGDTKKKGRGRGRGRAKIIRKPVVQDLTVNVVV